MSSLDVMLSSTSKDLKFHRELAVDACNRADFSAKTMDYLSAENDSNAIDVSMGLVEASEVYVGVFGMRYGFRPKDERNPNDISITEMEYRKAKELGMPILIYIMSDDHSPPDTTGMGLTKMREVQDDFFESDPRGVEKLELLKKEFESNEIVGYFNSAEDLRVKILHSLSKPSLKDAAQKYYEARKAQLNGESADDEASAPEADIPYPPELYAYPPYSGQSAMFVGRRNELQLLNNWSEADSEHPMLVVEAIGGMGKSALTWRWVQDRAVEFDGVFWYSFYEGGAEMRAFVRHALAYVTRVSPDSLLKTSFPQMLSQLVHALQNGRYLLVLDGLERVLVAYHRWDAAQMQDDDVAEGKDYRDCTNPRDDDVLRQLASCVPSKILITSRLLPNALTEADAPLTGVKHVELKGLSRRDAQLLWQKHGITWDDDGVMDRFILQFGRHSLLLKILVDIIKKNRRANGDFQVWYVSYGDSFDVFEDIKAKRNHILKFAYEGLSDESQTLLSQMAALGNAIDIDTLNVFNPYMNMPDFVPEPSEPRLYSFYSEEDKAQLVADYEKRKDAHDASVTARADYEQSNEYKRAIHKFDALLQDLEERGLIWWDANNRQYDLHPVVRGYAFSQLNDDDKPQTFDTIYNFFEEQERKDNRTEFTSYAEMQNVIAMYNALIGAGKYDAAAELFRDRIRHSLLAGGLGLYHKSYELLLPLFANGLNELPIVSTPQLQGNMLNQMGGVLRHLNRNNDALVIRSRELYAELEQSNLINICPTLLNLSTTLLDLNQLSQALGARQLALKLAQHIEDSEEIAYANYFLIRINRTLARWDEVKIAYDHFMENPSRKDFETSAIINYADGLVLQGVVREQIMPLFKECEQQNTITRASYNIRRLSVVRGELELRDGDYATAIKHYREAIRIGNEQGVRDTKAWSGLARAYALSGNLTQALRIIEDGVDYGGFAAAVVYMTNGDVKEATEAALAFYKWAWADGEPYVRRWELEQAKSILAQLSVPEPNLPKWDESQYEPFPHEEKVRALIAEL